MRWLYLNSQDPLEAAYRAEKLHQIDAWWRKFEAQAGEIEALFARGAKWDLAAWMQEHLHAIDERLMWEYGPARVGTGHRLVITPESEHALRPLLATVFERAPAIAGWEFYGRRLPESVETAQAVVASRTGGSLAETIVECRLGNQRRIDLTYLSPACRGANDEEAISAAFVATETLLGEEILDRWIGSIEAAPLRSGWFAGNRRKDRALPLSRLRPTVEALVGSLLDQLPPCPCLEFIQEEKWSIIELEPDEAPDYVERSDLLVAITGRLEMWRGAHEGGLFYSGRYSRCQETFCYLKLDGPFGPGRSRFADRGEIEDALNAALIPAGLGCVVGGGTGLRYTYIDLALKDCRRAVPAVRAVLAAGGAPERSWLQFFDDDLAREWIGVYETTPPPPA